MCAQQQNTTNVRKFLVHSKQSNKSGRGVERSQRSIWASLSPVQQRFCVNIQSIEHCYEVLKYTLLVNCVCINHLNICFLTASHRLNHNHEFVYQKLNSITFRCWHCQLSTWQPIFNLEGGSEIVLQMPENRPKDALDPIVYLDHSISHSIS